MKKCNECNYLATNKKIKRHEKWCTKAQIGRDYGKPNDIFSGNFSNPKGNFGK